jgi:hypothetical protein
MALSVLATHCRMTPTGDYVYDGIHLDPYEALFIPVSTLLVQQGHMPAVEAEKYGWWLSVSFDD